MSTIPLLLFVLPKKEICVYKQKSILFQRCKRKKRKSNLYSFYLSLVTRNECMILLVTNVSIILLSTSHAGIWFRNICQCLRRRTRTRQAQWHCGWRPKNRGAWSTLHSVFVFIPLLSFSLSLCSSFSFYFSFLIHFIFQLSLTWMLVKCWICFLLCGCIFLSMQCWNSLIVWLRRNDIPFNSISCTACQSVANRTEMSSVDADWLSAADSNADWLISSRSIF